MALRIAVCIKSVPDPEQYDKITIDPTTKAITRQGIDAVINPADKHALEAALKLKDQYGAHVAVIAMAPPEGKTQLVEALAMGADEGLLLSDRAFAGADTLATSYTLAEGIKKLGSFDLVFTGTESADGATAQVPAQVAESLNIPHLWNVISFELADNWLSARATVKLDQALGEYRIQLPALLAISRDANKARYATAIGIMKARKKPVSALDAAALGADSSKIGQNGSPTWPGDISTPDLTRAGRKLNGNAEEMSRELAALLRSAGVTATNGGAAQ